MKTIARQTRNVRMLISTALCAWLCTGCIFAAYPVPAVTAISKPAKVLFVGNSFTYYNDSLHHHLRQLVNAGKPLGEATSVMRSMTISGARLPEHAPAYEALAASDNWDVIVLQGHSLGPISAATAQGFAEAAAAFDRYNDAHGIQTALFMTWAYEGKPEMTAPLNEQYTAVGNTLNALVVPVGLAFAAATEQEPQIVLRHGDLKHPTRAGSYLAACTFYAALYGESPVGLTYDAGLPADTAKTLQRIAEETVRKYYQ